MTVYQDEAEYLDAAAALGCTTIAEGFEDETTWGVTRDPGGARAVTSNGVVWTSNHAGAARHPGAIRTGNGPARNGSWGVYSYPHGTSDAMDPFQQIRDGFSVTAEPGYGRFCGIGGWFTGLPGGNISVILDGGESNPAGFGPIDNDYRFYGALSSDGFYRAEIRETEGTLEDQKYVFADDFTILVRSPPQDTAVIVSTAGMQIGTAISPGSIASAFGQALATMSMEASPGPLPTKIAGTEVVLIDGTGTERRADLYLVSPGQINFVVPEQIELGPVSVRILQAETQVASGFFNAEKVSPTLFSANANGKGVAAAVLMIRNTITGADRFQLVFQCDAAGPDPCIATPLDLGEPTDQAFLLLFGTGIRMRGPLDPLLVTIGGEEAEVLYAGSQNQFAGMDQVNVAVPYNLRGIAEIRLSVDGKEANPLTLEVR